MAPVLYIVVPCYNEEEVLPLTARQFEEKLSSLAALNKISEQSRVLLVDDGSRDKTWQIITKLCTPGSWFRGLSLSRNRGHQNALLAGLTEAAPFCDVTVSIDCDGQDDIHAIDRMLAEYEKGADIVYGVRSKRETDSSFKRTTAQGFYRLMRKMGVELVYNHADYRLLSARVIRELSRFHEVNLFLRGMVPLVGFHSACVYYERTERLAGKSHYPLRKMVTLALNGITSLSVRPIRLITAIGFLIAAVSFAGILWSLATFLLGFTVAGWTSTVAIICFLSGIQLLSLGVIGEYIGKIYLETKARPRYIIAERTYEEEPAEECDPAVKLVALLQKKRLHISFAESCTGGLAAAGLVAVPAASSVFDASFVTYACEAKVSTLAVRQETLDACGAVSEEVAGQMARGAAEQSGAEIGVGISGIAGPTGGSAEKPVGTVCFGFSINGKTVTCTEHFGALGRNTVRRRAVDFVYRRLLTLLEQD